MKQSFVFIQGHHCYCSAHYSKFFDVSVVFKVDALGRLSWDFLEVLEHAQKKPMCTQFSNYKQLAKNFKHISCKLL